MWAEVLALSEEDYETWMQEQKRGLVARRDASPSAPEREEPHEPAEARKKHYREFVLRLPDADAGVQAEQSFRRIKGFNWMADVIRGVPFVDGVKQPQEHDQQRRAAA